jgi:hypothetical protein
VSDDSVEQEGIRMALPPELALGVYANAAYVWHTQYDFTLDFILVGQPEVDGRGQGRAVPIVARIKVPTQVIFQVAQAIANEMTAYENEFGRMTPPAPDDVIGRPE